MDLIRRCLVLFLTLAVVVTGAESAVARAEMASAIYPVLCGQDPGAPAQAFDATGKPLPTRHACPHCLAADAAHAALEPPPPVLIAAPGAHRAADPAAGPDLPLGLPMWQRPAATGPPFVL